jgi:acyl-CoA synthetase (AMP-forming)/AMP-acid ligase II
MARAGSVPLDGEGLLYRAQQANQERDKARQMSFPIAAIFEAVANSIPERDALIVGQRRFSYADVARRTNQLAHVLNQHNVTVQRERDTLENWECGQDTVALYMLNGNEYLECMVGAFKARAAAFNVNYRYVAEEIEYVLRDANTTALVYQRRFTPVLREVLPNLPAFKLLLEIDDGSDESSLPGALDYEQMLQQAPDAPPRRNWRPDDLFLLYTGGTTGMPKGVLWRQADSVVAQLAGRDNKGVALPTIAAFVERAEKARQHCVLATSPFMHGAGVYVALNAWMSGATVVIQDVVERLDPNDILATIERHHVNLVLLIGDAFGKPLADAAEQGSYDLRSVKAMFNTGALLSDSVKARLLDQMPDARIVDGLGSSETGPQAVAVSSRDATVQTGRFEQTPESVVINESLTAPLAPGHEGLGWMAKTGAVPLGYLGDKAKTLATFPTIDGIRYVIGGDRVRLFENGTLEFHGRDSFTINSGGEKIFVEEVELALTAHPNVQDVVVTGRPSVRWGTEVVAVVQTKAGTQTTVEDLNTEAATHIARYKLPKTYVFVEHVMRGDNGKADYRWAKRIAEEAP